MVVRQPTQQAFDIHFIPDLPQACPKNQPIPTAPTAVSKPPNKINLPTSNLYPAMADLPPFLPSPALTNMRSTGSIGTQVTELTNISTSQRHGKEGAKSQEAQAGSQASLTGQPSSPGRIESLDGTIQPGAVTDESACSVSNSLSGVGSWATDYRRSEQT